MNADEKIKKLCLAVAELARIVRDAAYQTEHGDAVEIMPSYKSDLSALAEEVTNLGTVL